ncbi:acetate--CoA ligase family protein [Cognatishimia sp. WU-CL00825]|uniref:acetate--CoA ligase family protein n=1 Tax=Cognatishimia sp. WU-CL00825 TaxID=3127658 RepID=UPI003103651B
MTRDLDRLFNPKTIAVIGGGAWCEQVIRQSQAMHFAGQIWPVNPNRTDICGLPAFASPGDLPSGPDAAFVGVNRHLTLDVVAQLSKIGTGGAVCFASGFSEASAEDGTAVGLQSDLVMAVGDMPILGPNCYGFINALDGALLWPDQHGCTPVDRGVAIITQSSNIAINLTMQKRGLPIAYTITCGNMAQTTQAQAALALLNDPRVTAIGLHVEGFGDLREWETLAQRAYEKRIPLVALKVGASDQAQQATVSHTASLAGSDVGAQALLDRLGIPRLKSLPAFLETLKLLHVNGPLASGNIASISCSGGEASLIADMALGRNVAFPSLSSGQKTNLRAALGPLVSLSNPLDYHTYIWRDEAAMTQAWAGMTGSDIALTLSIVDYPTTDPTDWGCATRAAQKVRAQTEAPFAIVATLPELLPEAVSSDLISGGVVPFHGLDEALAAIEAAAHIRPPSALPLCLPQNARTAETLTEAQSKTELAAFGLPVPRHQITSSTTEVAQAVKTLRPPFAIKGMGLAHKSEHGAVRLGISAKDAIAVAADIATDEVLIEEMTLGTVAELLVGVVRDPAHGFVMTLAAGGIQTELLQDTASFLLPANRDDIKAALNALRCAPLLHGYRGKQGINLDALFAAIDTLQTYVIDQADVLEEVEINPLLCTQDRVVAVDALIRKG